MMFSGMAQGMFQMSGLQHDLEHENLQRIQQATVLRGVSTLDMVLLTLYKPYMVGPLCDIHCVSLKKYIQLIIVITDHDKRKSLAFINRKKSYTPTHITLYY